MNRLMKDALAKRAEIWRTPRLSPDEQARRLQRVWNIFLLEANREGFSTEAAVLLWDAYGKS